MSKLIFFFLPLVFLFNLIFSSPRVSAQMPASETIPSFHSDIVINQDTSLTIKETITYFTPQDKHGIYRYLPYKYRRDGQVFTVTIDNLSIKDDTGYSVPFQATRDSQNLTLKIGHPDKTFTGNRQYTLTYTISDALDHYPTHDELYWDITGDGWQIPISSTSATITTAYANITGAVCYSGPTGTNNGLCQIAYNPSLANLTYQETVNYNDNVTLALKLAPENYLIFPSYQDRVKRVLLDNFPLFLIPIPLLLSFMLWYYRGRDYESVSGNIFNLDPNQPKRLKPVLASQRTPFIYEPLSALTPAQAGAILDEKVDNRDVIAELVDLARRQYLKIERVASDYTFTKVDQSATHLPDHQRYLYEQIFTSGPIKTLSSLKGSFYSTMSRVKEMVNLTLVKDRLYVANPRTSRTLGVVFVILVHLVALKMILPTVTFLGLSWPYVCIFLGGLGSLGFGLNLTQKSVVGNNLMLQAKGLKATLQVGKWREKIKEKHLFIEEVLPYAVAFGVIDQLAKDMSQLNLKPPEYIGSWSAQTPHWSSALSNFTTSAASTLTYNPSSSSRSGGSGFSGGSSGGGGGGGGGGSW